ncbi:NAD(P)-binding domain protein [Raphanus sativus]|nr:NAD(P)-binding domain protein [Raphanus sativus]
MFLNFIDGLWSSFGDEKIIVFLIKFIVSLEFALDQENVKYLPGIKLGRNFVADPDHENAVKEANMLVFVTPHQFMDGICKKLKGKIKGEVEAISLVKWKEMKKRGPCMIKTHLQGTRYGAASVTELPDKTAANDTALHRTATTVCICNASVSVTTTVKNKTLSRPPSPEKSRRRQSQSRTASIGSNTAGVKTG